MFRIRTTDIEVEAGTVGNTADQETEATRDLHIASAVDLKAPVSLTAIEVVTIPTADPLSDGALPHLAAGRLCPDELEKTLGRIVIDHYRHVRSIHLRDPKGVDITTAAPPPHLPVGNIHAPVLPRITNAPDDGQPSPPRHHLKANALLA
ncbi:MAG: hypothetical protein Q9224_007437, partial [Gallowayella concinna]